MVSFSVSVRVQFPVTSHEIDMTPSLLHLNFNPHFFTPSMKVHGTCNTPNVFYYRHKWNLIIDSTSFVRYLSFTIITITLTYDSI